MPPHWPHLAGRSQTAGEHRRIGSNAPQTLDTGTRRLLHDIATLVDQGLEHAEAVLHERRQHDEASGHHDPRTYQALEALAHVRQITRR